MKAISIIWTILKNLIALAIYGGMLSVTNSSFEKVTIAGLGLIYITTIYYGTQIFRAQLNNSFQRTQQFHRLYRNQAESEDIEEESELLQQEIDEIVGKNIHYYINMGFNSLIWFISVWAILTAL